MCCGNAIGINSRGVVVGNSFNFVGGSGAFLWVPGGPVVDLQTLVQPSSDIALREAVFINDRGEIAADGLTSNGDLHAVLLIPCDEDHSDIEGCDYSSSDGITARSRPSPLVGNAPGLTPPQPAGRQGYRSHSPRRAGPKN
jgi:probable HAF family extracellular repeat protein